MSDTNTAASTSNAQAQAWVNRFGTLKGVQKAKTAKGADYVRGTIVGKKAEKNGGGEFEVRFVAYAAPMIAHILAIGNGGDVNLRGVVESYDAVKEGGKYSERQSVFKAIRVNEKKAAVADAEAQEAGAEASLVDTNVDDQIPF